MNRPKIKEYFGENATLQQVADTYNSQPELFNYAQALDRYIDELEESPVPDKVEDVVEVLQKQIDRLEVHDEMLLNTICEDLKKAVKILKKV